MKTLEEKIREKFAKHMSLEECIQEITNFDLAGIIMAHDKNLYRALAAKDEKINDWMKRYERKDKITVMYPSDLIPKFSYKTAIQVSERDFMHSRKFEEAMQTSDLVMYIDNDGETRVLKTKNGKTRVIIDQKFNIQKARDNHPGIYIFYFKDKYKYNSNIAISGQCEWKSEVIPSYFETKSRQVLNGYFKDIYFDPITKWKTHEIVTSLFNNIRMISFTKS